MQAPEILIRSMSVPTPRGGSGDLWQYHSRSDLHSKVACWGVLFDLLETSALLRHHVGSGAVVFGVNHPMHDFVNNKRKALDLVLARPSPNAPGKKPRSFLDYAEQWAVLLSADEQTRLASLPHALEGPVGSVLVAMEAKACMTEHSKARPRLYDELNSSHQMVHAASNQALAVGFVMINGAERFVSPDRNRRLREGEAREESLHSQPRATQTALQAIEHLPRRSDTSAHGYDGLGVVVVDMPNDGSPVRLMHGRPAPQPGEIFHYDSMIQRIAGEYDAKFHRI